jgi:hypothetical protein
MEANRTPGEAGQDMPTKISFVYYNPTDPAAFEAAYPEQLAMARKLPGLTRLQTSRVWPKEDGSPTPAYRMLDLYVTRRPAPPPKRQGPWWALPSGTPPEAY